VKIEIGQKVENKSVVSEYARKRESLRKYASLGKTTDVILAKKFLCTLIIIQPGLMKMVL